MASSSSSSSRTWRYRVFTSFHGPDVRKTFLSHLRKEFICNGITMFDDQGIERGQTISPELTQGIRESRISIVLLSKNYASSSWCLDELLEILKCKEDMGQIVMTVFYGVNPSDVRKQTGEFGMAFNETCARKTEEERRKWSQALNDVGNIAGEHFLNWDNESKMIEKIARDVSNKLNATPARDFEDMALVRRPSPELYIADSLAVSSSLVLWRILGEATMVVLTSMVQYRKDYATKKCFIILDDVDDLKQLEALANETNWFGPGSRIIVTTEDQEILEQHDIKNTYHVDFPTKEEACKIFCRYAFRRSLAPCGFVQLAERVTELCSNLPLGLRVMGSTLRGKKEGDWEGILHRLENSLDQQINGVLRVGYDTLHKDDQYLFLLIAFFFNYQDGDHVKIMLSDSNLDVSLGLKTLTYKSIIQIANDGNIVMHKLLQQVGREAVQLQNPKIRKILIDTDEICDVLENGSGSRSVMGISFDISTIQDGVYISARAFKKMCNLRFLNIYKTRCDGNDRVHVPEDMGFPPRLRLLRWDVYPGKCLPRTFSPEYLVELKLQHNKLEKLWEGTQRLTNLKKMDLTESRKLKELPDLSNATNLEQLTLVSCKSLVRLPSSIGNLHKLEWLLVGLCRNLQIVPSHFNLASLERVEMYGCWKLRKLVDISTNITTLFITETMLEEFPESIRLWSRLQTLRIQGSLEGSHQSGAGIKKIPDCIKYLHGLKELYIVGCPKLVSLPELPSSLTILQASNCESLETVSLPFDSLFEYLHFPECFKLGQEARTVITQQSLLACLPGSIIPAEFDHRAIGNSLTIRSNFKEFRMCVVVSPRKLMNGPLFCRIHINGFPLDENIVQYFYTRTAHLCISHTELLDKYGWLEQDNEISFEFSTSSHEVDIIECGVQILMDKTGRS
ncbi:unnamed protein product [Arabidopsis lyrata]|nr:unnamed protein product [Arabidopsis lyrata]